MRNMKKYTKKIMAVALAAAMVIQQGAYAAPQTSAASKKTGYTYLQAATMPKEIMAADSFYVGTTSADLDEASDDHYLLKIGRGGKAEDAASVTLKLSDATSNYGKDYQVFVHDKGPFGGEAISPDDNRSLLDIIKDNDVIDEELTGPTDADSSKKAAEAQAEDYYKNAEAQAEDNDDSADANKEEGDYGTNPLAQAKENLTGVKSDREVMTSSKQSMVDYMSDVSNYITEMVPGASLKVDFAKGETEKYVEIVPIDNDEKDGNRVFYLTLSDPSEGYTNSSVSESMFTIVDDEPEEAAEVSFSSATYNASSNLVKVKLLRTGNLAETVQVDMVSVAGSAVSGKDFSPVNASVVFPFGVTERTLEIAVDNKDLKKEADFTLKLKKGSGAVPGKTGSATVTIPAFDKSKEEAEMKEVAEGKGDDPEDEIASLQAASLSDVVWGPDLVYPQYQESCGGGGSREWSGGHLKQTVDDSSAWDRFYMSQSKSNIDMYIYDGFKVKWSKDSKISSWSKTEIEWRDRSGNGKIVCETGDKPRFDTETRGTYWFTQRNASEVRVWVNNWKGKKNVLETHRIDLSKRPFKVSLQKADTLSYVLENGQKAENKNATGAELYDVASGKDYAIKYAGDYMVIRPTNTTGISRLVGAVVYNPKNKKQSNLISSKYIGNYANNSNALQIALNNDFCRDYNDYINYEANGDGGRLCGSIVIKPVFDYINSEITVNRNEEIMANGQLLNASIQINGQNVNYGQTYTYHFGDSLVFTSKVDGNEYTAAGFRVRSRVPKVDQEYSDIWFYENNKRKVVVDRSKYTIVPYFTENNNRIVVRVNESDLSKFKKTGMFDNSYFNKNSEKGNGYYDVIVVASGVYSGQQITLAAETNDEYMPIWKEVNNSKYYMGNSFEYKAKDRRTANIVYLYAGSSGGNHTFIKGRMFFENNSIKDRMNGIDAAGTPVVPAPGGYIGAGEVSAVADENGNFATDGFVIPKSIVVGGSTVTFDDNSRPLYIRATLGAAGATETKDIKLKTQGKKVVKKICGFNFTSYEADSFTTDLGNVTIRTNNSDADNPVFEQIYVTNKGQTTETVYMNGESTDITVVAPDKTSEKVKKVSFLIYDKDTNAVKKELKARQMGSNWTATYSFEGAGSDEYAQNDKIFVQMTTDKAAKLKDDPSTKNMSQDAKNQLNQTIYAPVFTGLTLVRTKEYDEPTVQKADMGTLQGMDGLPLVNNFNGNMNLGPVQLGIENLYDDQQNICGTRIKVGMGLDFDKTSLKSDGSNLDDAGNDYGGFLKKVGDLKGSFSKALDSVKGDKTRNVSSLGGKNWGIYPIIGFYMDFALKTTYDAAGQAIGTKLEVQGGGIYFGGTGKFSVAWYALIPVVFIPCYFGISGELTILLQAGGTTKVTNTEEEVQVEDFTETSHNISEELVFDFQLSAAATVQVYCGVGICGTLGVRGGLELNANFIWYPTLAAHNTYFNPVGATLTVGFKMWVDLLLFTIPIPVYTLADYDWGLNKQYKELKDKNADDLKKLLEKTEVKNNNNNNADNSAEDAFGASEAELIVKDKGHKPSEWAGDVGYTSPDEVKTMATFKEKNNIPLLSDGYDNPDAKLLDMGDNGTLLVFLSKDMSRQATEITSLTYSVYKDGVYSEPVAIQKDSTADFQPNVCEAGDDVIITWISSDPNKNIGEPEDGNYQKNYLKAQEVYSVKVSKQDLADHKVIDQTKIARLTDDDWYNSNPFAIYNSGNGDYNVYYVATAEDTAGSASAVDLANPMNTDGKAYSVIGYRVYSEFGGRWEVEHFLDAEKPAGMDDTDYENQLKAYNGQRFLSSPIKDQDVDMEDPLIADLTGISYNGIGVYAFTVDKDNSADTVDDRDLFVQFYNFNDRKTYVPVRITNDNLSDTNPQIVRKGGSADGTTYLFWKSDNTLSYIDLSSLVKYGIDENGKIKDSALHETFDDPEDFGYGDHDPNQTLTEEELAAANYKFEIFEVDPYYEDDNQFSSFSQYKVAVDKKDNLYVIYVDNGSDVKNGEEATQDIFATAMIDSKVKPSRKEIDADTEVYNEDPGFVTDDNDDNVKKWSQANRLTDNGQYSDGPAFVVNSDGNMVLIYNTYDLDTVDTGKENEDGTKEQSVEVRNIKFMSSILEPYGSIEAEKIELSDTTPVEGEDVRVDVTFKNTGLTATEKGFDAKVYLEYKDGTKKDIDTFSYEGSLAPVSIAAKDFTFTADDKIEGAKVVVETTEKDLNGTNINKSNAFEKKAEYTIVSNNSYQGADSKFYTEVEVTNTGNVPGTEGDVLKVLFDGPYADASSFGLDNDLLASEGIALEPGESKSLSFTLDVPASAFNFYGKIRTKAQVFDKDGKEYKDFLCDDLFMYQPAELSLNQGKELKMNEEDTKNLSDLGFKYSTIDTLTKIEPMYVVDDQSVVTVEDDKLVAVGAGTTTVTAYASPYGTSATMTVTVEGKYSNDDDVVNPTKAPSGIDLSGTKVLYEEGTVAYDEATGAVTGTNVKGLLIPLGVTVPRGAPVDITVSGTASTGMRSWLSDGNEQRMSDIMDPVNFDKKYTLIAEPYESGDTADHFQLKGPSYDSTFSKITITKVVVDYDPSKAPTPSPEPTARPTKAPTAEPKVTDAPVVTDAPKTTDAPNPTASPAATTVPAGITASAAPGATTAPTDTTATVDKAKIKIKGKKTVKVGKTIKLTAKLTNVKGKVKWSINKKKLATIKKTKKNTVIKLQAKKTGTVTVVATIKKVKGKIKIKIKK